MLEIVALVAAIVAGIAFGARIVLLRIILSRMRTSKRLRLEAADRARQTFNPPQFAPPKDTDWTAIVNAIELDERSMVESFVPRARLRKDLVADAVTCSRHKDNFSVFGILRVTHPGVPDHLICAAMQTAARLLHAANTIPYEDAVVVDPKLKRRLPLLANVKYSIEGFVPNPDLKRQLSEYVAGCSDEAYAEAIDDLLFTCKRHWMLKTFDFT